MSTQHRDGSPAAVVGGETTRPRLHIGLLAPPWVPVPPTVYGGTELVIDLLARGLRQAGHDVTLFTTGDSTCPVPRRSLYDRALGTAVAPVGEAAHVERGYRELTDAGVDVIHDHTLVGPVSPSLHPAGVPVVTTVHGQFTPEFEELYTAASRHGVRVVAISESQRNSAPHVPVAAVIHHGVDLAAYPFGTGGDDLVFLGRMSPDKGVHRAIEVARAAGRRLVIAAKMWEPAEHRYFHEVVKPMLGPDAVYIGEVAGPEKVRLLGSARAILNPIRWPEPFGLVMIEALACGTPVVAFPEGAAPEIVDHGRTGFLCADEHDMADRVGQVGGLSRQACRDSVRDRFSAERMVADHLALYRRALDDCVLDLSDGVPLRRPPSASGVLGRAV